MLRRTIFEADGRMTVTMPTIATGVELLTGRRTSQRLPRSPRAAAEELEAVLAHDPLDAANAWAQALPQPAATAEIMHALSYEYAVDWMWQREANLMYDRTREWASYTAAQREEEDAMLRLILLARFMVHVQPRTVQDEEDWSLVEWQPLGVLPGVVQARSWDERVAVIFRFRRGRNLASVVARTAPQVRYVHIEYQGHIEFIYNYDSGDDDVLSDDSS